MILKQKRQKHVSFSFKPLKNAFLSYFKFLFLSILEEFSTH